MSKSKVVAGTMFGVCATIVVGMGLYLPFYSSAAKQGEEARRQLHMRDLGQEKAPGGVWKNLNAAATKQSNVKPISQEQGETKQ